MIQMSLEVSEIFKSIQGEGPWVGRACTFVRLSNCNKECSWCDTYQRKHKTLNFEPNVLAEAILGENVVITGGEPMIYKRELFRFVEELNRRNKMVAIETNGTIPLPARMSEIETPDLIVVSPKINHSKLDDLGILLNRWEKYKGPKAYKFVVVDKRDVDFIIASADEGVITGDIFMQPCEPEKKAVPHIMKRIDYLEQFNIRLIPQTHKYLKVQ